MVQNGLLELQEDALAAKYEADGWHVNCRSRSSPRRVILDLRLEAEGRENEHGIEVLDGIK